MRKLDADFQAARRWARQESFREDPLAQAKGIISALVYTAVAALLVVSLYIVLRGL